MALIRHAMDSAFRGELPLAIPQQQIVEMMAAGAPTVADYYRAEYEQLWRDTREVQKSLLAFCSATSSK